MFFLKQHLMVLFWDQDSELNKKCILFGLGV